MIIKKPTKINAGAVAKLGIAIKIGLNTIETKNSNAVTTDARPVLAPSETPEELSTKVVVVDVPKIAPTEVAIESANKAGLILGSFPSLSSISALDATPIRVPSVSNMSTNRNANMMVRKLNEKMPLKSSFKNVGAMLGRERPELKSGSTLNMPRSALG